MVERYSAEKLSEKPLNYNYSGLTLNQDKATKPQTVQIVRQGEATPYWFKVNPLYICCNEINYNVYWHDVSAYCRKIKLIL
ncbi:hypothetical protein NEIMUCOT_04304 [Neisseria mucosa ATCC 25996]|uniref:Uncharacterized protein n=1 Tax=Neisseria mucosa (strain ATCC 25996 / DSM 4631 / NCTC 10774 / M26) TaxID=546266 RepID=D2ZUL4_NEIM2|nr:hypothetical protein NEIMUCOT_04304 [Neisseria mucosa ATCC 25996]